MFGLLAIVVVAPTQYSFEIREKTYLSLVDPLIWLVCLLWLVHLLKARKLTSIKPPPIVSVLFVLMAALSTVKAVNLFTSLKDVFQLVEYFIAAFLLFACNIDSGKALKRILYVFLGTASVIILFGLVQYLNPSIEDFKVGATFGNRNVFGGYLSLILPLMYGLMLFDRNRARHAWFGSAILIGFAINLAGGTFLALLLSVAVLSILKSHRVFLAFAAVALLGAVLVLPCLLRNNGAVLHDSVRLYDSENNPSMRYTEWQAGIAMVKKNPFLGVGIGNYQNNIRGYYGTLPSPPTAAEPDSQNLYLVLASSVGLPGLACFLGMLFFFSIKAIGVYFRSTDRFERGLALGLFGSIIAFSINSIWSPLLVRGIGVPLVLIFGLIIALDRPNHE